LSNLLKSDPEIDTLILGCTHYPLILHKIEKYLTPGIKVISQGELVAASLADYLHRHPEMDVKCTKNGSIHYFTTESVEKFSASASIFLHEEIQAEHLNVD